MEFFSQFPIPLVRNQLNHKIRLLLRAVRLKGVGR